MASTGDSDSEPESLPDESPTRRVSTLADDEDDDDENARRRTLEFDQDGGNTHYSDEDDDRDNRFIGSSSNWRYFTEDERALAASLDQQRANDLSLHLYCAHTLKAGIRDAAVVSEGQSSPSKKRKLRTDEDETARWQPSREWTSWPLKPDDVPRRQEHFGVPPPDASEDATTYKKREDWRPSADLEEEIQALMQRRAKELFMRGGNRRVLEEAELDVLADDEQTEEILRPHVRRTVSKLDDLFTRLHKMKQSRSRSSSRPVPGRKASATTFVGNEASASRSRSRSRIRVGSPNDSYVETSDADPAAAEDEDEHAVLPSRKRNRLPKPRDWNDVLRIAVLAGFDRKAVDRAASRCVSLFGQASKPLPTLWYCPVRGCDRKRQPFEQGRRWREHLKRTHRFSSEKIQTIEAGLKAGVGGNTVDGDNAESSQDGSAEIRDDEQVN